MIGLLLRLNIDIYREDLPKMNQVKHWEGPEVCVNSFDFIEYHTTSETSAI